MFLGFTFGWSPDLGLLRAEQESSWHQITSSSHGLGDDFANLGVSDTRYLWVAHFSGLTRIDYKQPLVSTMPVTRFRGQHIKHLLLHPSGMLWVNTIANGLHVHEQGRWNQVALTPSPSSSRVSSLAFGSSDDVWILVGNERLGQYSDGAWTFHEIPTTAGKDRPTSARSLWVDRRNRAWLILNDGGLLLHENKKWHTFTAEDGSLPGRIVSHVITDADHAELLVVVDHSTLASYELGEFRVLLQDSPRIAKALTSDGNLLLLHGPSDLTFWKGGAFTRATRTAGVFDSRLTYADVANRALWTASDKGVIARFADDEWIVWDKIFPAVSAFHGAKDGTVWLATRKGVYRWSGSNWFELGPSELRGAEVRFIAESAQSIWIGTFQNGIFRYHMPKGDLLIPTQASTEIPVKLRLETRSSVQNWKLHYRLDRDGPYRTREFDEHWTAAISLPTHEYGPRAITTFAQNTEGAIIEAKDGPAMIVNIARAGDRNIWLATARLFSGSYIALWLLLFCAYPFSSVVRRSIFWNGVGRKTAGLFIIDALIVAVPQISRMILAPFVAHIPKPPLSQTTFYDIRLRERKRGGHELEARANSLPIVEGRWLLLGESGTGKTTLAARLTLASNCGVFIRASECTGGVVNAIASHFPAEMNDSGLLMRLIQGGRLTVVVDGLNEAGEAVRKLVLEFVARSADSRIVVVTQPIGPLPPIWDVTYVLEPLSIAEAGAYLQQSRELNAQQLSMGNEFLRDAALQLDSAIRFSAFDLELLKNLLAQNVSPTYEQLTEQHIAQVSRRFRDEFGADFPLIELCARAAKQRVAAHHHIDLAGFSESFVAFLRAEKILVEQAVYGGFVFRHEQIADYFIALHFARASRSLVEWRTDVRFKGVFRICGKILDNREYEELLGELAIASAEDDNHLQMDAFVLGRRDRQLAP